MAQTTDENAVPTEAIVKLLGLDSAAELYKLSRERWVKPVGREMWRPVEVVQGVVKYFKNRTKSVTAAVAAEHIFMSDAHFRELVSAGVIPQTTLRTFDLDEVRKAYIMYRRATSQGQSAKGELSTERTRLAREQADVAEMKGRILRGEYVGVQNMRIEVEQEYAVLREKLLALGGANAAGLVGCDRAEIERILNERIAECLTALSDPDRIIDGARRRSGAIEFGSAGSSAAANALFN